MLALEEIQRLYKSDTTGETGLYAFLQQCRTASTAAPLYGSIGKLMSEPKANYKTNPSREFLRWLIENPDWIVRQNQTEKMHRTMSTVDKREALFSGCPKAKSLAISSVQRFAGSLKSEWWRFEGTTDFDLVLLTDSTVIAIDVTDGQRSWPINPRYPQRHYLFRSLDCVHAFARLTSKQYFYYINIAETSLAKDIQCELVEELFQSEARIIEGLPHLSASDQSKLLTHFLGVQEISTIVGHQGFARAG